MDYQVDLAVFRGPLDLLLYLVNRNEVDICDIPMARITEQFLEYLHVLKLIDVEQVVGIPHNADLERVGAGGQIDWFAARRDERAAGLAEGGNRRVNVRDKSANAPTG